MSTLSATRASMPSSAPYDAAASVALETLLETLLDAGYLNVLNDSMSLFDKVVGGLCWGVLGSGGKSEVDSLLKETGSIGERISLAESIVKSLRGMNCPHALQAHQIHGGDFVALLPVVFWLVKAVQTKRSGSRKRLRQAAWSRFLQHFGSDALEEAAMVDKGAGFHRSLTRRYCPERKLRLRWEEQGARDEEVAVRACLLEFGERFTESDSLFGIVAEVDRRDDDLADEFEKQYLAVEAQARQEAEEQKKVMRKIEERLLRSAEKGDAAVNKKRTKQLVQLETQEIQRVAKEHEANVSRMDQLELGLGLDGSGKLLESLSVQKQHQREVNALRSRVQRIDKPLRHFKALQEKMEAELGSAERVVRTMEGTKKRLGVELDALVRKEDAVEDQEMLGKLTTLVETNDAVKRRIKAFKASCKKELKVLQEEVEDVDVGVQPTREMQKVDAIHASATDKFQSRQRVLAERSQTTSALLRQVDEVPTRSELVQYERRFLELYEQVAAKLDETKRHVNTFNTLKREFELMEKEESLLGSVNETFPNAMKSSKGRAEFLTQFESVVVGLRTNVEQAQKQKDLAVQERNTVMNEYQALIEKQRNYFTAVADLQRECDINDKLLSSAAR